MSDEPEKLEAISFACRCDADGEALIQRYTEWALEFLDCLREDLMSSIVFALLWRWRGHITGIDCDQWFGIAAETYGDDKFVTWVECDNIEDGFVYTLRAFYDHFGEGEAP